MSKSEYINQIGRRAATSSCDFCNPIRCANRRPYRIRRLCKRCARIDTTYFTSVYRWSYGKLGDKIKETMGECPMGKTTFIEYNVICPECFDVDKGDHFFAAKHSIPREERS